MSVISVCESGVVSIFFKLLLLCNEWHKKVFNAEAVKSRGKNNKVLV